MSLRNEQHHQLLFRSMLLSLLAGLITLWGLLAIYRTLALTGNWEHFLLRQGLWAAAAWIVYLAMSRLDWDFDRDPRGPEWDIEFSCDGFEYSYEIHGESGTILEWEKERDR